MECMYAMHLCHTDCRHARAHAWINRPTKSTGRSSDQVPDATFCISQKHILVSPYAHTTLSFSDPGILVTDLISAFISPSTIGAPLISGSITRRTCKFIETEDARISMLLLIYCSKNTTSLCRKRQSKAEENEACTEET
jgi:hypothetical protein